MPVRIRLKEKTVFEGKASTLEFLYNNLIELIENRNMKVENSFQNFLNFLYQACFGVGLDIADYLKNKKDLILLAQLLKKATNKYFEEFPYLPKDTRHSVLNFYNELVKYIDELD